MKQAALRGKRILLVDDDPLVLRIYGKGLVQHEVQVLTAVDGLEAMKALGGARPDAVVLDLMMPTFSGQDVLKFIRAKAELADLPVVVLSNAYLEEVGGTPTMAGAQRALLKFRCTPSLLAATLVDLLGTGTAPAQPRELAPQASPRAAPLPSAPAATTTPTEVPIAGASAPTTTETDLMTKARQDFLRSASPACAALQDLFKAWVRAQNARERGLKLEDFYRRLRFLGAAAGFAQCPRLALLCSVLEALLFQVMDHHARLDDSVQETIASAVGLLQQLARQLSPFEPDQPVGLRVLVLKPDPAFNRLVVRALKQAGLEPSDTEVPLTALQWLQEKPFDLVLLDKDLPGHDPIDLARQMQAVSVHPNLLVLFISESAQTGFFDRSGLSPNTDFIFKPSLPMEIPVKVVTHLLKVPAQAKG